jgi:putative lipase involved disintegration of autophagic bodies
MIGRRENLSILLNRSKKSGTRATWVQETIRVAKPGKAVIVEQASYPSCDNTHDWGGVAKDWWYIALEKYGWDVDVDSIEMMGETLYLNGRCIVFMRKTI